MLWSAMRGMLMGGLRRCRGVQREEGRKGREWVPSKSPSPPPLLHACRSHGKHREALGLLSTEERCVAREKGQGW